MALVVLTFINQTFKVIDNAKITYYKDFTLVSSLHSVPEFIL